MKHEEKNTLKRFVVFYFGTTFILLGIIFILIYKFQLDTQKNLAIANMKNFSFKISSNIIQKQMKNKMPNCSVIFNSKYKFMLLNKEGKKINGDDIDRSNSLVIEDKSPLGHMGVWSIIVEDNSFNAVKKSILHRTILGFFLSYLVLGILGYYLIKLLLKPIKEARLQLDNFIKDTTHELNTPITALLMCANESSMKNPKNIDRVFVSARRVSEIYKDLTYIFLEDKNEKILKELNLKELIDEQMSYFYLLADKKKINIDCKLDDTKVVIDREDFKRLFSNLISNTIKYNKKGGDVKIVLKNGILTIEDTGIGIDRDKINNIFDRYYRTTENSGGFGIGLNIVRQVCNKYNIGLDVSSIKNKGTKFILKFTATQTR